jgi:hypothetical protein
VIAALLNGVEWRVLAVILGGLLLLLWWQPR